MMKVPNNFYHQFEKLNNKLDLLFKENKNLKKEFKEKQNELKATILKKIKLSKKLLNKIDRPKNQINKNSGNSSKPSSTDIVRPKKREVNLYNLKNAITKKSSVKKKHKGHRIAKEKVESLIK